VDQPFTAAAQLRFAYSSATDVTIVQGNVDNDDAPEFEIQLMGHMPLTANAFVL